MAHFPSSRDASRRVRNAFTLIELLVVIAIIAILAAILFPVFAQAREKGRQAACISNVKQIGLAALQYAQDFDETLPQNEYVTSGVAGSSQNDKWMDVLQPEIKNKQVFNCPSDKFEKNREYVTPSSSRDTTVGNYQYGSYAYNNAYYSAGSHFTPPQGQPLSAVVAPANTVLIAETQGFGANADFLWKDTSVNPVQAGTTTLPLIPNEGGTDKGIVGRHQANVTVLWCDGHAKAEKVGNLLKPKPYTYETSGNVLPFFTIQDD